MASIVGYSKPLALNVRMVLATTVREIPRARAICLALKVVVMQYLMISRVFFTPVLLRAIRLSFRLRVLEGECSSTMVEGLERSEVSDRAPNPDFSYPVNSFAEIGLQ
jgi:hypothetical protein